MRALCLVDRDRTQKSEVERLVAPSRLHPIMSLSVVEKNQGFICPFLEAVEKQINFVFLPYVSTRSNR